jgi:hypothetical protein
VTGKKTSKVAELFFTKALKVDGVIDDLPSRLLRVQSGYVNLEVGPLIALAEIGDVLFDFSQAQFLFLFCPTTFDLITISGFLALSGYGLARVRSHSNLWFVRNAKHAVLPILPGGAEGPKEASVCNAVKGQTRKEPPSALRQRHERFPRPLPALGPEYIYC